MLNVQQAFAWVKCWKRQSGGWFIVVTWKGRPASASYLYVSNFQGDNIQYIFQVDSPRKIYWIKIFYKH